MEEAHIEPILLEYTPYIRAYLHRRGVRASALDSALREVMRTALQEAPHFDADRESFAVWVFRIARNQFVTRVREARRPEPDPLDPCWEARRMPSLDSNTSARRRMELVRSALAEMPVELRAVLEAIYLEGVSVDELARSTGVPVETVRSRVRTAIERLRKHSEAGNES